MPTTLRLSALKVDARADSPEQLAAIGIVLKAEVGDCLHVMHHGLTCVAVECQKKICVRCMRGELLAKVFLGKEDDILAHVLNSNRGDLCPDDLGNGGDSIFHAAERYKDADGVLRLGDDLKSGLSDYGQCSLASDDQVLQVIAA